AVGVAAVVRRRIELVGEPEAGLDDRELDVARGAAGIAHRGNAARRALAADRGLLVRREVGPEGRCAAGDEDESGEQEIPQHGADSNRWIRVARIVYAGRNSTLIETDHARDSCRL